MSSDAVSDALSLMPHLFDVPHPCKVMVDWVNLTGLALAQASFWQMAAALSGTSCLAIPCQQCRCRRNVSSAPAPSPALCLHELWKLLLALYKPAFIFPHRGSSFLHSPVSVQQQISDLCFDCAPARFNVKTLLQCSKASQQKQSGVAVSYDF